MSSLVRGGLFAAILVVFASGLFYRPDLPHFPDPPPRETDLRRVYDQLESRNNFDTFSDWCALKTRRATPGEEALLSHELAASPPTSRVHLPSPFLNPRRSVEWYRVSDPTERHRWVGIGVVVQGSTGRDYNFVVARIPVGFRPPE